MSRLGAVDLYPVVINRFNEKELKDFYEKFIAKYNELIRDGELSDADIKILNDLINEEGPEDDRITPYETPEPPKEEEEVEPDDEDIEEDEPEKPNKEN